MYYPSRKAAEILGLHPNTLRKYADNGTIHTIRTPSGQRRYDIDGFLGRRDGFSEAIGYCRVSGHKQKDDLARQRAYLEERRPDARIVSDVGSGLNFKRKGLNAILDRAMRGDRIEVVVAHRDRLARFGYDLIERIITRSGGRIVVLDDRSYSPEDELSRDLLSILHVFSARMHGLRRYKSQIREDLSNR